MSDVHQLAINTLRFLSEVMGWERFGASVPAQAVYELLGFSAGKVLERTLRLLQKSRS